jgi:hypothetical protein
MIRGYPEAAEALAGRLQKDLRRAFRRDLMDVVANKGTERDVWAKFHDIATKQHGLDNYSDAVDVEAFSVGYNDGLKARQMTQKYSNVSS